LGLGNINNQLRFKWNENLKNRKIISIDCGYLHSLFLDKDGFVYSCGRNNAGQCGLNIKKDQLVPSKVIGMNEVIEISAGLDFSVFLRKDGRAYSCGGNEHGQLGLNISKKYVLIPKEIKCSVKLVGVSAMGESCWFVGENNKLFSVGKNYYGECCVGHMKYAVRNLTQYFDKYGWFLPVNTIGRGRLQKFQQKGKLTDIVIKIGLIGRKRRRRTYIESPNTKRQRII
jgi:alpha-tubulin suppressor-like RCC1 family protein